MMHKHNKLRWLVPFISLIPLILVITMWQSGGQSSSTSDSIQRSSSQNDSIQVGPDVTIELDEFSISQPVTPTTSPPLRDIPLVIFDRTSLLVREVNPRVSHNLTNQQDQESFLAPPTLQAPESAEDATVVVENFIGSSDVFTMPHLNIAGSEFSGVFPPDTVGAVGKEHYIQLVNSSDGSNMLIYDKSEGSLIHGPIALDSLGTNQCAAGGGDPIILYDQLADRWFASEFHSATQTNSLCHYVSKTADPLGEWHVYQYDMPTFPDYPKYGLWPNAYLGSANESDSAIYAFDRLKMLNGVPASFLRFTPPELQGFNFQALTPVDLDGFTTPPAEAPSLFLRHVDDEVHQAGANPSNDFIEIWAMTVDFITPLNSEINKIATIPIGEFDSSMCGVNNFSCVPQKGSAFRLDPVREILMHRVAYMNFGSHQSIVGNMVTDPTGNNDHGIFWFELRNSTGSWELYQEGIFAPDAEHRWMGSIGIDTSQNIALLYNISGNVNFPSLFYTGRTADMPLGTMLADEGVIATGTTASSSTRYGDYSALTLDPFDGCTFWGTGQYNPSATWATRIAKFSFPNCVRQSRFTLTSNSQSLEFIETETIEIPFFISAGENFTESIALNAELSSMGPISTVSPSSLVPTTATVTGTVTLNSVSIGDHTLTITGTSPFQTETVEVDFSVLPLLTTKVSLLSPKDGEMYVPQSPTFSWSAVIGASSYDLEIASGNDFSSIDYFYSNLTEISFIFPEVLPVETTHSWRVRPVNSGSQGEWASAIFTTEPTLGQCPAGVEPTTISQTGFEDGFGGWESSSSSSNWVRSTNRVSEGEHAMFGESPAIKSTKVLTSPSMSIAPEVGNRWLSFDLWRDLEGTGSECYDGMILEIEQNGIWQSLGQSSQTDPYDNQIVSSLDTTLAGQNAWCGSKDWTNNLIRLNSFQSPIRLRFTLATDASLGEEGVYLDNLHVYECEPERGTYFFPAVFN